MSKDESKTEVPKLTREQLQAANDQDKQERVAAFLNELAELKKKYGVDVSSIVQVIPK